MSGRGPLSAGLETPGRSLSLYQWWVLVLCALVGALVATTVLFRLLAVGHPQAWVYVVWALVAAGPAILLFDVTVRLEQRASRQLDLRGESP